MSTTPPHSHDDAPRMEDAPSPIPSWESDGSGLINRLIIEHGRVATTVSSLASDVRGVRDELRRDRMELQEDRRAIGSLARSVEHLATSIDTERQERRDADAAMEVAGQRRDKRIAEIASKVGRAEAWKAIGIAVPVLGAIGAAIRWVLTEGPSVAQEWAPLINGGIP